MASIDQALPRGAETNARDETSGQAGGGVWITGLVAAAGWLGAAALIELWPEIIPQPYGRELAIISLVIALGLVVVASTGRLLGKVADTVRYYGPWAIAGAAVLAFWEVITAKTGLLPVPFFSSPQSILEVFLDDWSRLGVSVGYSVLLLAKGFFFGAVFGFLTGVSIGWSQAASYWVHPLLRIIGPLPATAWLPLAFFIFPTSGSASVFLIAFSTAFPVAILTWSGVASVNKDYYDIARTLGASQWFLISKVAIPAALPNVFVGLFMGLTTSFAVLVVAEMLGVKAGLGWYLQWAQGWAAYNNMYAALLVMALMCSGLITVLFKIRDWTLSWQKGVVRW
jgi:NitT/TauT family transport system permease protein